MISLIVNIPSQQSNMVISLSQVAFHSLQNEKQKQKLEQKGSRNNKFTNYFSSNDFESDITSFKDGKAVEIDNIFTELLTQFELKALKLLLQFFIISIASVI